MVFFKLKHKFDVFFRQYIELLHILRDMYQLGFVLISQEVNMVWGPRDPDGLYDLIEIVFIMCVFIYSN